MRRTIATALALTLVSGAASELALPAAHAVGAAEPRVECPNAAVNYLHAVDAARATGKWQEFGMVDWSSLEGLTTWEELPDDFRERAEAVPQQAIRAFLAGTRIECCQFYIARNEGINTLLPHVGPMRQLARIVRLDARAELARGNVDAAAERLAGLYRLSMHVSTDEILISSMVGVAMAAFASSEVVELLNSGRATAEPRQILADALGEMGDDPFRLRATIYGERDWILGWVRREFRGPDAGAKLAKELAHAWGASGAPDEFRQGVELLDEAKLHHEIERLERYYDEVTRLWDAPDAVKRLEELDEHLQRGEFGLLSPLAGAFAQARAAADRIEGELARTLELVEESR